MDSEQSALELGFGDELEVILGMKDDVLNKRLEDSKI
jgi:hypothetical protein